MTSCNSNVCDVEFGFSVWGYKCSACGKQYCDKHCANVTYVKHLTGTNVEKTIQYHSPPLKWGYLCEDCLLSDGYMSDDWNKCIIRRKCAAKDCGCNLHDFTVVKQFCGVCGKLFCSSHTRNASELDPKWVSEETKYRGTKMICEDCVPITPRTRLTDSLNQLGKASAEGVIPEVKAVFNELATEIATLREQTIQQARQGYIVVGLRATLAALAVFFMIAFAPFLRDQMQSQRMFTFPALFTLLGYVGFVLYLTLEFIVPGWRERKSRPYAVSLLVAVLFVMGMSISVLR